MAKKEELEKVFEYAGKISHKETYESPSDADDQEQQSHVNENEVTTKDRGALDSVLGMFSGGGKPQQGYQGGSYPNMGGFTGQQGMGAYGMPTNHGGSPMQGMPMNQMPMNQMPMNQMPMNQMPMNQMPMNQMPMNQMPMNQMPMNQSNPMPGMQMPSQQASNSQNPIGSLMSSLMGGNSGGGGSGANPLLSMLSGAMASGGGNQGGGSGGSGGIAPNLISTLSALCGNSGSNPGRQQNSSSPASNPLLSILSGLMSGDGKNNQNSGGANPLLSALSALGGSRSVDGEKDVDQGLPDNFMEQATELITEILHGKKGAPGNENAGESNRDVNASSPSNDKLLQMKDAVKFAAESLLKNGNAGSGLGALASLLSPPTGSQNSPGGGRMDGNKAGDLDSILQSFNSSNDQKK